MMSIRVLRLLVLATVAASTAIDEPRPARALEGGQSAYAKGLRDFMSGVLPPPGVLLRNDVTAYSGRENSQIPQGQLSVGLRGYANIFSATVSTPLRILGGNYAFGARFAGTDVDADSSVTTRRGTTTRSGTVTGLNDMVLNPVIVGWHAGNLHWNVATAVWIPAGGYETTRLANTGKNYWSWSPQLAATYADPQSGWEISAAFIYLFNFENTETRYRSGDVLHIDVSLGRRILPRMTLGVVGYLMEQTTGDSGAGATLGERKAQVVGLGPGARFDLSAGATPVTLVAKYYREFSARHTTQGDSATLSVRVHF
jgi:hypothetical protein